MLARNVKPNETMVIYLPNVKLTCDLLSKTTHLDCHKPIYLNTFLRNHWDCLGHLTKMAATPIYGKTKYRSTSLSQSPREWRKYFELSKVRLKQNVTSPQYDVHVQFLQDIRFQYLCSQTVTTENRIEMKTKEIHFSLFYFHLDYVIDRHNATALGRDKQYCENGDFLNYW